MGVFSYIAKEQLTTLVTFTLTLLSYLQLVLRSLVDYLQYVFYPIFLHSSTGSSPGSGISFTCHVSIAFNLKPLYSLIIRDNYFYTIDSFEEYSSLHSHLLFILIEHSSFPVCLMFLTIIFRYHSTPENCIDDLSFSVSQHMVHIVSLVTLILIIWSRCCSNSGV